MEAVKYGGGPTYQDYTSDNARGPVEFYLDTSSNWNYKSLIEHL